MKKKRNLFNEIGVQNYNDYNKTSMDVNIEKVTSKVLGGIFLSDSERKCNNMKKNRILSLAAAVAVIVLGVTVFAASGVVTSWTCGSWSFPDYTSIPTEDECINDAGYAPVLLETFHNGFTFDNGNVVKNSFKDENGKNVENFKSFSFRYAKNDEEVILGQAKYESDMATEGELITNFNGINIYFEQYTNKTVPVGYEKTESDIIAEQNGDIVFSYDTEDQIAVNKVKGVTWDDGNMHYSLIQINGTLSQDDFVGMAQEIISVNNL